MQDGGLTTQDFYDVSGKVLINGEDVGADVKSLSFGRDVPSGLPGDTSFRSSTGTVTAVMGEAVASRVSTPWGRVGNWPPQPTDRVELVLSDGTGQEWTQFRGTITNVEGGTGSRVVTIGVQDNYQSLKRLVTLPALSNIMPNPVDGNDNLHCGLESAFITDWVLRQAGRYATPRRNFGNVVSATMLGSVWPEYGFLEHSVRQTPSEGITSMPSWEVVDYGLAVRNVDARYLPNIWSGLPGQGRLTNGPVELTQEVVDTAESTFLRARFDGGGRVALVHYTDAVSARYFTPGGDSIGLITVNKTGLVRVSARFSLAGSTLTVELRVRRSDGSVVNQGTATRQVGSELNGQINHVWANGVGTQGAFQVSFPSASRAWESIGWEPNAQLHVSSGGRNNLLGLPTQVNEPAENLLNDQAAAELAAWWIDELDVLHWWDRGLLSHQPVSATLTGVDHVRELNWSHDYDSVRHQITVRYDAPVVTQRWRTNITLWQGSGDSLDSGDTEETFINTPSDEVWLGVSVGDAIQYVGGASWVYGLNKGWRSVIGGIAVDDDGVERSTSFITPRLRRVTDATFVAEFLVGGVGHDEQAVLRLPSEVETDPTILPRWRGEKLPILRGKKLIQLTDEAYTSEVVGPDTAPSYEHDTGFWVQQASYAGQTADYLAASLTIPRPTLEGVEIMPVFNLQVGDVVIIFDSVVSGLEVRGLVTSNDITADLEHGTASQRINLLPLAVRQVGATWVDFGEVRAGDTWSDFGDDRAGDTWADFGQNPLD